MNSQRFAAISTAILSVALIATTASAQDAPPVPEQPAAPAGAAPAAEAPPVPEATAEEPTAEPEVPPQPAAAQPTAPQPATAQPATGQPATAQPAPAAPVASGGEPIGFTASASSADQARPEARSRRLPLIAPEIEAGVGLGIPTGGLSVGPSLFLGGGARVLLGPGSFAAGLRVGFQSFSDDGAGTLAACADDTQGTCIAGGGYSYELSEKVLTFAAPLSYRFLRPDSLIVPYVGFAPKLFLSDSTVTAFGYDQSQGDSRVGFAALLGGRLKAGPGGVFVELAYQYGAVEPHDPFTNRSITGEADVGAVGATLGYRLELEHLFESGRSAAAGRRHTAGR
jgi:hypothetical protein